MQAVILLVNDVLALGFIRFLSLVIFIKQEFGKPIFIKYGSERCHLELPYSRIAVIYRKRIGLNQMLPPGDMEMLFENFKGAHKSDVGHINEAVKGAATRFTTPTSTTKKYFRSTPRRVSFKEDCDYLAHYCLKAYDTGELCGRTLYYRYYNFKNYCLLDYVNCMERYEIWQVVHMGKCFKVKELTEYIVYPYDDDFFLDQYYIIEDN